MTFSGPFDANLATVPAWASYLREFNEAGALSPADIHVAAVLCRLGGDEAPEVALAAALAVRAPRVGHVMADLASVAKTLEGEGDLADLPWPSTSWWAQRLADSPAVSCGEDGAPDRPLRLVGTALYLDRYWRDEDLVARELISRALSPPIGVDEALLADGLARIFPGKGPSLQRDAAEMALKQRFSVIAGGPGTGKTTVVARFLALVFEQALGAGTSLPLVALAAPTGKAASRLAEAVHEEAVRLATTDEARSRLLELSASTLHRLLGTNAASASRFRHNRDNRLPHDVVVVDETSMLSLPLVARLLEAVREDARLVLLGDPQQLASVEAGAVLADIAGPPEPRGRTGPLGSCTTVLRENFRFGGAMARLSEAVRLGDAAAVLDLLRAGEGGVGWLPLEVAKAGKADLGPVQEIVLEHGRPLLEAARAGDVEGALASLGRSRVLCGHRDGPDGAATWNALAEQWLMPGAGAGAGPYGPHGGTGFHGATWYPGRPLIVAENDYNLGLFNGDVGVVVARQGRGLTAVFRRGAGIIEVSPSRVPGAETAFALTAHRAQGSEFDEVVVVLPTASSRVLTRELLYTAITRARRRALLVGTEEAVVSALARPVARASGLAGRLWPATAAVR